MRKSAATIEPTEEKEMSDITLNIPDFFPIVIPGRKKGVTTNRKQVLRNLTWVLQGWAKGVCEAYVTGSRTYNEVAERWEEIGRHIRPHLSDDEWYDFSQSVLDEETGLFIHDNFQRKRT